MPANLENSAVATGLEKVRFHSNPKEEEVARSCDPMDCSLQDPLSMRLPRQEYWSGLSLPSPGDLTDPGIEPVFPAVQEDSLPLSHQGRKPAPFTLGVQSLNHLTAREVPLTASFYIFLVPC